GYGGMPSLAHAWYLGVAAYVSALLTSRYGWGHGPAALISIAGTTATPAFFGVIALRASGLGFLMITLALSQVLWGLAYRMSDLTNGDNGIAGLTRPMPFGFSIDSAASFYWFTLIVAWFAFMLMTVFVSSSFGSSLKGVRDQPRRRVRHARRPHGRRRAGAAVEELRLGLSRTLEHAARAGVPVHRSGDAQRDRPR